jgi:hypothetical protein
VYTSKNLSSNYIKTNRNAIPITYHCKIRKTTDNARIHWFDKNENGFLKMKILTKCTNFTTARSNINTPNNNGKFDECIKLYCNSIDTKKNQMRLQY